MERTSLGKILNKLKNRARNGERFYVVYYSDNGSIIISYRNGEVSIYSGSLRSLIPIHVNDYERESIDVYILLPSTATKELYNKLDTEIESVKKILKLTFLEDYVEFRFRKYIVSDLTLEDLEELANFFGKESIEKEREETATNNVRLPLLESDIDLSNYIAPSWFRELIYDEVIDPIRYGEYDLDIGLLLYGYPGNGKSYLARCIAGELGWKYFRIDPTLYRSHLYGMTEKYLSEMFNMLRRESEKNHIVLVFDDCEEYFVDIVEQTNRTLILMEQNRFLHFLEDKPRNILAIATTNYLEVIRPAFLRAGRFLYKIYVPFPDKETRRQLAEYYTEKYNLDLDNEKRETVLSSIERLEYYTCEEISKIILHLKRQLRKTRSLEEAFRKVLQAIAPPTHELEQRKLIEEKYGKVGSIRNVLHV